jgi:hypothetical protein
MITVICMVALMTLLVMTAVVASAGTTAKSGDDEDWNGALAAAFAGLEEYQSRLSEEPGYLKYGNPSSPFSSASTVTLPPTTNKAFGLGVSGTWQIAYGPDVNGSPGPELFRYRYEVDNSTYSATGNIRLRATGRVGTQTRTVVADVRQAGFIDYVYFTNFEMGDPSIPSSGTSGCQLVKWYDGRSSDGNACRIQFISADQLHGPVHSNDSLFICGGATFDSVITTGNPAGGYSGGTVSAPTCTSGSPNFAAGPPVYSQAVPMPATNGELIKETRTDIPDDVPRPGCLYTGPTSITFISGGYMTVKSPWTKMTNIANAAGTVGNNSQATTTKCGTIAALKSAAGATVPVLQNNVVYVQNIPLTGDNGTATASTQTTSGTLRCKKNDGSTVIGSGFTYAQNVVGFPVNGSSAATTEVPLVVGTGATASYGCRNGDVFVSGTNSGGPITIAAQNYIYVTGDLRDSDPDVDMIGLVGQNAVWVYNPKNSSDAFLNTTPNRRIDAAILSVAHTFTVQNHNVGSGTRGTLTVFGSIAQMFRGPVGTAGTSGVTGYTKNYLYDPRFRYSAPPKFLAPATTTYGISVWVEISPVFHADGSCQVKQDLVTCV